MTLRRHTALNLAGSLIPILVGLPAFGVLARVLGPDRFGLVTLAWALLAFMVILDLGFSRAIIPAIHARPRMQGEAERLLSSAIIFTGAAATLVGLTLWTVAPWIARSLLKVPASLLDDATLGLRWLALCAPLTVPGLLIQGYWEAFDDFHEANIQRAIAGTLVPLLAVLAVLIQTSFTAVMAGVAIARLFAVVIALARRGLVRKLSLRICNAMQIQGMLRFGSWMTLSGLVSPIMATLDRYLLGYFSGTGAVAYYAAPVDLVVKMLVIPTSITRSLFPKLAAGTEDAIRPLLTQSSRWLFALIPLALLMGLIAPWLLRLWLGEPYDEHATAPLRVLLFGFVAASFAQMPYTRLQAASRTDVIAKIHMLEVVPTIIVAALLMSRHGAIGAAWAWTLRAVVDWVLLASAAKRLLSKKET